MPPLIRPVGDVDRALPHTSVIAPNIRTITIAVMIARSKMRRRAVREARSTASAKRVASRASWPNAWTIFIAPSTSPTIAADVGDAVLAAARDVAHAAAEHDDRQRRPAGCRAAASAGQPRREHEQIDDAADAEDDVAQRHRDGRADHLLDHRVSAVSREAISDGRFSSKKRGARRSRLCCTATRMSATHARRATRRNRSGRRSPPRARRPSATDIRTSGRYRASRCRAAKPVDDQPERVGMATSRPRRPAARAAAPAIWPGSARRSARSCRGLRAIGPWGGRGRLAMGAA